MRLTRLRLDARNQLVRSELSDPYQMHCTLARAFADDEATPPSPFLWRLESGKAPQLLVQSNVVGNWNLIERRNRGCFTGVEEREFEPGALAIADRRLRFRLRANPSVKRDGKRHALYAEEAQLTWVIRQMERVGAEVRSGDVLVSSPTRISVPQRRNEDRRIVVFAAQFDGVLTVRKPDSLVAAVGRGIGHGKHLGLGLLSLGPT